MKLPYLQTSTSSEKLQVDSFLTAEVDSIPECALAVEVAASWFCWPSHVTLSIILD